MHAKPVFINLGCGNRYHPDWVNIDIYPQGPGVIQHDLSLGIPLSDSSCDVVYHAAVLEHMKPSEATKFITDCYRVLKPRGILRVGVPDLERICRIYLSCLESALNGNLTTAYDYDWMMLELFDQSVRESTGGKMLEYLRQNPLPNEAFVYERIGLEGRELVERLRNHNHKTSKSKKEVVIKIILKGLPKVSLILKRALIYTFFGKKDLRAYDIGRFRSSGEVHQWMYDRYSLARLLGTSGFTNIIPQDCSTSQIPGWLDYHLDVLPDEQPIKPDLLFMEATKPEE